MSKYGEYMKAVKLKLDQPSADSVAKNGFYEQVRSKMASNVVRNISESENFAFDSFLGDSKIKVASLDDLFSFDRVATDTLIHKASKELWSIELDGEGQTYIAKLFDGDGSPLRV